MSKIMELVRRVLVSESNEDLNLIQAEVTRMEAEAKQLKNTATYWHEMSEANGSALLVAVAQRDELQAKLAALEAQEPFAWSIFDGEGGEYFVAYECNETYKADYETRNPNHLNWVNPLYTAAGAKQESATPDAWDALGGLRMKLCPICGNKRCPKANNADLACTGSNEVGQLGSSWEHVKPFGAKEPNHG